MRPSDTRPAERCASLTRAGKPCQKAALPGTELCATHAGAPVGRPTHLTPEVAERVLTILRAGGYLETAAAAAGVSLAAVRKWITRGNPEGTEPLDEPFRTFRIEVDQARAEGETRNVTLIAQAALTNWQAAAWLLERQYPERWARPSQREKEPDREPSPTPGDPFAEVDELARRRGHHG